VSARADRGREEVYAAELAAFDGTDLELVVPVENLIELASTVTGAAWWPPDRRAHVRPARRDAAGSATRWRDGRVVVTIAAGQSTPATLVHELAHVLAGADAAHGPRFRRAHVDLAIEAFGARRGAWLADAYRSAGLALAPRRWAPPSPAHAGPIAL
jgi:hypothetical protein